MEMIVQEQAEVSSGDIEPRMLENEIYNECGRSVAPGSGWFVNRVTDCDSYLEKVDNGKAYPKGEYLCTECDSKVRKRYYGA